MSIINNHINKIVGIAFVMSMTGLYPAYAEKPSINSRMPDIDLASITRGQKAILALGDHLPAVAEAHGKTKEELVNLLLSDLTLNVDHKGRLFYADELVPIPEAADGASESSGEIAAAIPLSETFLLHSRPGATKVIYLDFDGHILTGTAWNASSGVSTINCPAFDFEGGTSVFTDNEKIRIQNIWKRVAEDFAPFDVDVTTEYPGESAITRSTSSDTNYGTRVLISPISQHFGNYGGIAYIGAFNDIGDYYKPALVFPENLGPNGEKYVAEASSHEAGHNFGLNHDGTNSGTTYYAGHGSGATGWAPIMGNGYYKSVTQWSKGEYTDANNTQDDLSIIASYIPYRPDDHGDTVGNATDLPASAQFDASGTIDRTIDVDVFSFQSGPGTITIDIDSFDPAPNLDILAELLDNSGAVIASNNPSSALYASISHSVSAGTYYLRINGVGYATPSTGYSDYASLGEYTITGNVPDPSGNVAPIADASASPASGNAPLIVAFNGSASSDQDGNIVSYQWNFGDGSSATSANVSHTYIAPGNYTAILTVTDNDGLTDQASVLITALNNPPTFTSDPVTKAAATEDLAYSSSIAGNAADIDGDPLTFSKLSGPAWLNVASNGSLSGTPGNPNVGLNTWSVQAVDGNGGSDQATLQITVFNVNDAPVFTSDPIMESSATQDVAYSSSVADNAMDLDGDNLTFSKVSGPAWLTVAGNGTLSGTPTIIDNGSNSWSVEVSDGNGGIDTATLMISVLNPDITAPVLSVPGEAIITLTDSTDPSTTGQATATDDRDPSPLVTYSDTLNGASPNPHLITRTWTATDAAGNSSSAVQKIIVIKVTDQFAQSEATTFGSVNGSYLNTQISDNVYESLTEHSDNGKPSNRRSLLDHQWTFNVVPGDFVMLYMEAYHTANSEGDDFAVHYSTDGTTYTEILSVTTTSDTGTLLSYELPATLTGIVYIAVTDMDSTLGNYSADSLYVDLLMIQTEDWPGGFLPPGQASEPNPADQATQVPTNVMLSWTSGANTDSCDVYFGTSPGVYAGNTVENTFNLSDLAFNTTYYWRIDSRNDVGTSPGTDWSFTTQPDPSAGPYDIHVEQIHLEAFSAGRKEKARASVTIMNDMGTPVSGATVTGSFSGDLTETRSAVTDVSGVAVITTAGRQNAPISFTFTVDDVTGSLPYDPSDNVITTANY